MAFLQREKSVFLTVAGGVFMSTMDSSMVNVALPAVMKTFHCSLALTEWVILVYLLTITALLLFWGRMCLLVGCGRVYITGMMVFSAGSFFCGMAPGIGTLVLFRFIQGLGASMMMATGPALIKSIFPVDRLGRGIGMIGVATSLGLMTGPVVGGLLIHWLHWRAIFWVTVPVGLFLSVVGRATFAGLPQGDSVNGGKSFKDLLRGKKDDPAGAIFWAAVVTLTVLLVAHASSLSTTRGIVQVSTLPAGVAMLAACWICFLWFEGRRSTPFFPLSLFGRRFFAMAVFSSMLSFAALFMVLILTPFYLDRILGLAPDRIGYVMMAVPLCVFIVSPVAGRLHDLIGARIVATCGLVCCFAGLAWQTSLTTESTSLEVAVRLALIGFGQAMFLSPNSASALAGVPEDQVGVTASMLATARNFGMLTGTALAGLLFSLHFAGATGGLDMKDFSPAMAGDFMFSLQWTYRYGLVISFAAVVFSLFRGKK